MKCIHPTEASYRDACGVLHYYTRPCGHCIACLHNMHDAWSIRALETQKEFPMFVYDTLTFRPSALPCVEIQDILDALPVSVSEQSDYMLRFYSKDKSLIPYVTRDIIRNWIKRGREAYSRDKGKRPDWRYMVFMEYGPKTSRPHFHLLFWNISKVDYKRYFGLPWYRDFGKTKPTYFNGNSTQKDRECISKYISKYCSKGVFESPWVKDKLVPRPFKFCSNGLGAGFLRDSRFAFFFSPLAEVYKGMTPDFSFKSGCLQYANIFKDMIVRLDIAEGFKVPASALDALSCYRDSLGHPHALPRYYKQKLLNLLKPSVFSHVVQTHLLARIELQSRASLQRFVLSLGQACGSVKSPTLGLSRRLYDLWSRRYAVAERLQAFTQVERCKTWLINHYLRPARPAHSSPDAFYGVTDNFLALVC